MTAHEAVPFTPDNCTCIVLRISGIKYDRPLFSLKFPSQLCRSLHFTHSLRLVVRWQPCGRKPYSLSLCCLSSCIRWPRQTRSKIPILHRADTWTIITCTRLLWGPQYSVSYGRIHMVRRKSGTRNHWFTLLLADHRLSSLLQTRTLSEPWMPLMEHS